MRLGGSSRIKKFLSQWKRPCRSPLQPSPNPESYSPLQKPPSHAKYAMAILMIIHQFIAYAIFGTALAYIWEKLLRIHTKPWYIRLPCRIPISEWQCVCVIEGGGRGGGSCTEAAASHDSCDPRSPPPGLPCNECRG